MKKATLAVTFAFLVSVGLIAADGPLTNFLNLRGRHDANGYVLMSMGSYTAPDGPLTALSNLRARTDSNGYVIITPGAGGFQAPVNNILTTSTPGNFAVNNTASDVVNTQQLAPMYGGCGSAWKSNATAASEFDCAGWEVRPATGSAATSMTMALRKALICAGASLASCTWTDVAVFDQNMGRFSMTGNIAASGSITSSTGTFSNGGINLGISTGPSIGSGFGTSPSIVASGGNGTYTFRVNVGTGGVATSGVITMPSNTNGWNCNVQDQTTAAKETRETADSTTSVTVTTTVAWTASDILQFICFGR